MSQDKLVVIGASYLQRPVIEKARAMGLETHVFAWREGSEVEDLCDVFHPISIVDVDRIHAECERIRPRGVLTIASDLAATTVGALTHRLGLVGNRPEAVLRSTHKRVMRRALRDAGVRVPAFSEEVREPEEIPGFGLPLVVKPTDRSGSRGVTLVEHPGELRPAIEIARAESLRGDVIVEEFIPGRELSVEAISWKGRHRILALTDKETTGPPDFVEIGHHQPAVLDDSMAGVVCDTVLRSLDVIGIEFGASHSEVIIADDGRVFVVEIAGRMGGDFIGSTLVEWSTGYDYLRGVIEVALGIEPHIEFGERAHAGIVFPLPAPGRVVDVIVDVERSPEIRQWSVMVGERDVVPVIRSSADRVGYWMYRSSGGRYRPATPPLQILTG
jgi:biotin carboxylase